MSLIGFEQNSWKGLWDRASCKLGFIMVQTGTKIRNASQFLVTLQHGRNKLFPTGNQITYRQMIRCDLHINTPFLIL
jgi:hypothetical protein